MIPKIRYKIGQKVRVRNDLKPNMEYGSDTFIDFMTPLLGKLVTIKSVTLSGKYTLFEDTYDLYWTDEMFVGIDNDDIKKIKEEFLK